MAKLTGGGIQSRVVKDVGVKAGPPSTNIGNPGGVAQLGAAVATKSAFEPVTSGKAAAPPLGNAVAAATDCRPGGSRTIYRAGSQSTTPTVHDLPPGRNTLSEFGPDYK